MADVLIAVEDPGAANYMLDLPGTFAQAGLSCRVLACGHASEYLRDRNVAFEELHATVSPQRVLELCNARVLLAGTSQNPESPVIGLIETFRTLGRPTVGFVDMAVDADLRFKGISSDPLGHAPDFVLAADAATGSAFEKLGLPRQRIRVCGHPVYDRVRRRSTALAKRGIPGLRKEVLGADPWPRPVWLFAAEHDGADSRMRRADDYTLFGRGQSTGRVDIVLEEVLDAREGLSTKPFVILRLHPKNNRNEFSRYLGEFDLMSIGGDALTLILASDLVIGLSSIFLMEAAIAGRPTLCVVPREAECAWSPSVTEGLTPCATTRTALRRFLATPPEVARRPPETDSNATILEFVLGQVGRAAA